jgi:3-dehydroquinate synthase
MDKIEIHIKNIKKSYDIEFCKDFEEVKKKLKEEINNRNCLFITDDNVFRKTKFFNIFSNKKTLVLKNGEINKNFESINKILKKGFEEKLDRESLMIAIGGGVVGDMVGFASSIYMRGINFIQIPTTLLSMVDSSVGGKTGIDNEYGKNLIGTFHQPKKVLCCKEFLSTLKFIEIKNGLSEMIKHGIISKNKHLSNINNLANELKKEFKESHNSVNLINKIFNIVPESIKIKKEIIEKDETEKNIRKFLNLGHTYGHAIEILSNFKTPHGIAVAKGILCSLNESKKQKILSNNDLINEYKVLLDKLNIDYSNIFDIDSIKNAMTHDKKNTSGIINLVLVKNKGEIIMGNFTKEIGNE